MRKKEHRKPTDFLTHLIIIKFCGLLSGLDAIKDPREIEEELPKCKQLKRDIENVISITPYLFYISLLSGV